MPLDYNSQFMEEILPEHLLKDWGFALYDAEGQAHDLERTGLLLLKVALQELVFIEDLVKKVSANAEENITTFYQTDDDTLIQEYIDDEVLCIDRFIIRVCKHSDEDALRHLKCNTTLY
ncbi:hypothetical protein [Piscirickettsia salmonis]|uniref:hypothetical protein n=1 Tax=Piscirickettsia salmonis TaxID=1238 RepID=UPI00138A5EC3|nr:hypothetical protein [Piscirickettsia salmonis]